MIEIPVIRWGKSYESLETEPLVRFDTGEPLGTISQANGGLVTRDMRSAKRARQRLREFSCQSLLESIARAGELFESASLPLGNGEQTIDDYIVQQSATTGLPQQMCRMNVAKNAFVLRNMSAILDALTRGMDLEILSRGYGKESRNVIVSYQAQAPVLGAVLPSNSPGVHTLWLPVIPLQLGLALKPGSLEPWTAYRVMAAFVAAGIPAEVFSIYPGGHDVGQAILTSCSRSMIFGSEKTVAQYAGNPSVQVHGPGFSKIFLGDDCVDRWPDFLDLMVESVCANGGRSCINCSGIWASRHTQEIAEALAERLGPIEPRPVDDPQASLAAFTAAGQGQAVWEMISKALGEPGVKHCTERFGNRLAAFDRYSYLRPTVVHCDRPQHTIARQEFMFPFVSVVCCPQDQMIAEAGPTLVGTAITDNAAWIGELTEATNIDRLNIGEIPTVSLNWLQPHEGNLIDFLFRSRALQTSHSLAGVA